MKLTYLANIRLPTERAHGLQIMKTCEALASKGISVSLVLPGMNRAGQKSPSEIFDFYGVSKNFEVRYAWVPPLKFLGNLGMFMQSIWFVFSSSFAASALGGDVVYARQPANLVIPAICGKKVVFESHEGRTNLSVRLIFGLGARVLTITRAMQEMYVKRGLKADKIGVIPDAADTKLFGNLPSLDAARSELGIDPNMKIAMYVGSFGSYDWKGVDVFLEASNLVRSGVKFFAVGGKKSEIEALESGAKYPNVIFVEKRPPNKVPLYLAAANTLVIPNKTGNDISDLYTSPMKLFEYMASGKPIVASGLRSILEIVDEESAVIVRPNDPIELASGVDKVIADTVLAEKLSKRSKELAKLYTWEARAELIIGFIHKFYERH